ncbi:uncharacterized protein BYT42DRAFT_544581 [Radiomyces spectabilis]|uniref:uncharacterized protein n=1 Tax=Radiomyces spectabilis TaxID=64574 RepID=UPI00222089F6|nr:uncharacterized protein BYT42DRAFT_544581 [Radiomyces spectabilis]KAI8384725.1 hypothetical protein BYT42DRAFT_544581 [Radiomyces spectabilis]
MDAVYRYPQFLNAADSFYDAMDISNAMISTGPISSRPPLTNNITEGPLLDSSTDFSQEKGPMAAYTDIYSSLAAASSAAYLHYLQSCSPKLSTSSIYVEPSIFGNDGGIHSTLDMDPSYTSHDNLAVKQQYQWLYDDPIDAYFPLADPFSLPLQELVPSLSAEESDGIVHYGGKQRPLQRSFVSLNDVHSFIAQEGPEQPSTSSSPSSSATEKYDIIDDHGVKSVHHEPQVYPIPHSYTSLSLKRAYSFTPDSDRDTTPDDGSDTDSAQSLLSPQETQKLVLKLRKQSDTVLSRLAGRTKEKQKPASNTANRKHRSTLNPHSSKKALRTKKASPKARVARAATTSGIVSRHFRSSESISTGLARQRLSDTDDDYEEQHDQDEENEDENADDDEYQVGVGGSTAAVASYKKGRNVDKACNHCKRSHLRCDDMRPCRRCISTGKTGCKDVQHKPRGRPKLHKK